jgi:hypothetical protein
LEWSASALLFIDIFCFHFFQAVNFNTGTIIHDQFVDDEMRSQLETRMTQLQPLEVIVQQSLSSRTAQVVRLN